jgi:hypothetical protein
MRRRYTAFYWSNCWIAAIWLRLTGRCVRLVLTKSSNGKLPHLSGITRHEHLLGFCHGRDDGHIRGRLYPLWFRGCIGGVKRKTKHHKFGERVILGKL